jgi:hypothetical protein
MSSSSSVRKEVGGPPADESVVYEAGGLGEWPVSSAGDLTKVEPEEESDSSDDSTTDSEVELDSEEEEEEVGTSADIRSLTP